MSKDAAGKKPSIDDGLVRRPLMSHHGRVFDVVRPGKTIASPTSRPVIPVHKDDTHDHQFVSSAKPAESQPQATEPVAEPIAGAAHAQSEPQATAVVASTLATPAPVPAPDPASISEPDSSAQPVEPTEMPATSSTAATTAPVLAEPTETSAVPIEPAAASEPEPVPATNAPAVAAPGEEPAPDAITAATPAPASVSSPPDDLLIGDEGVGNQAAPEPPGLPAAEQQAFAREAQELLAKDPAPEEQPMTPVVSRHRRSRAFFKVIFIITLIILVTYGILNLLLDTEVFMLDISIPHTNFF